MLYSKAIQYLTIGLYSSTLFNKGDHSTLKMVSTMLLNSNMSHIISANPLFPRQLAESTGLEVKAASVDPKYHEQYQARKASGEVDNEWSLTPANWKKHEIDSWMKTWWQSKDPKRGGFLSQLYREYTGGRMEIEGNCGVNQHPFCVYTTCENLRYITVDSMKAMFALKAAGTLIEYLKNHYKALNIASWDTSTSMDNFIRQFSYAGQLKQDDNKSIAKDLVTGAATALTFGLAFIPGGGPISVVIDAVKDAVVERIGDGEKPERPNPFIAQAKLSSFLDTTTQANRDVLETLISKLITGEEFTMSEGGTKMSLNAWWQEHVFVDLDLTAMDRDLRQYYQMIIGSKILNAIWKWDSAYIMALKSENRPTDHTTRFGGGAQSDLYQAVKWCDPNDATQAYYMVEYGLTGGRHPQIIQPRGCNSFNQFPEFKTRSYPVDQQKVIESSVMKWKIAGGHNLVTDGKETVVSKDNVGANGPRAIGARYPGIYSIPVCASSTGNIAGGLNTDDNKRYPCTCEPDQIIQNCRLEWDDTDCKLEGGQKVNREQKPFTIEFLKAANLRNSNLAGTWDAVWQYCAQRNPQNDAIPGHEPADL